MVKYERERSLDQLALDPQENEPVATDPGQPKSAVGSGPDGLRLAILAGDEGVLQLAPAPERGIHPARIVNDFLEQLGRDIDDVVD